VTGVNRGKNDRESLGKIDEKRLTAPPSRTGATGGKKAKGAVSRQAQERRGRFFAEKDRRRVYTLSRRLLLYLIGTLSFRRKGE